jgi:single-strand DNA-binding protein
VVEIKARRIQFLNKRKKNGEDDEEGFIEDDTHETHHLDDDGHMYEYKYLSSD